MRIGPSTFAVGEARKIEVENGGTVQLMVNDDVLSDNSGSFEVNIELVERVFEARGEGRSNLQLSGKWSWRQSPEFYGYFTIQQDGDLFTGTLDDVGEGTYKDNIVDGKINGNVMTFTRSGRYGIQYWRGEVLRSDDTLEIGTGLWRKEGQTQWFSFTAKKVEGAEPATAAFSLPVTSDTEHYRKFDSTAVLGKFHTGDDYYNRDLKVLAATCGVIVRKITNGVADHGFGNALIIRHNLVSGGTVYSLYGHLSSFDPGVQENKPVARGQTLGVIGNTGSGSGGIVHLHFEIKRALTLANPDGFGSIKAESEYGYVSKNAGSKMASSATDYGYFRPNSFYGSAGLCR
jgi:murein DD-endopeptidase MepM/ murein hydrolase activator NlpD